MHTTTTTIDNLYRDGDPTRPLDGWALEMWVTINWACGTALANECLADVERWEGMVAWLQREADDNGTGASVFDVDDDIIHAFPCLWETDEERATRNA